MSKINISDLLIKLDSEDKSVRAEAVKIITSLDNRTFLKDLVLSIKDNDKEISSKAIRILTKNSIAESVEYIEQIFDEGCNDEIIKNIIKILAFTRTNNSFSLIKKILKNIDEDLQNECIKIISMYELNLLSLFSKNEIIADINRVTDIIIRTTDYLDKITEFFSHPDKNVRIYCLKQLKKTKHSKTISYILPCLNDKDWEVRKVAVEIIGSFYNEKLIDVLIKSLNDTNIKVREATKESLISMAKIFPSKFIPFIKGNIKSLQRISIKILGNSNAPHIIPDLISSIDDENIKDLILDTIEKLIDSYVADLKELEKKGEKIPINIIVKQETLITEPISSLLNRNNEELIKFAVSQLLKFNVSGFKIVLKKIKHPVISKIIIETFEALGLSLKKKIIKEIFETNDKNTLLFTLELIKKINSKDFIPILIKNLEANDENIKIQIIDILRRLGYENQYIKILSEDNSEMRLNAVKILSNFRSPKIAELLASHLNDPEKVIRKEIVLYLSNLESAKYIPYFVESLDDPVTEIQVCALEALNKIDTPESYNIIKSKIRSTNLIIKRKVTEIIGEKTQKAYLKTFDVLTENQKIQTGKTLKKINPSLIKTLTTDLQNKNSNVRVKAVRILATIIDRDDPLITPLLVKVLDDPEKKVRATIATALKKDGSDTAFQCLIKLLNDPNERVRANVIEGLESCGKPREIIGMLLPFLKDNNNRIRANTVMALYNLGYTKVFNTLVEMLKSTDRMMKISAIYALGELKIEKAIPTLKMLLNDEDNDVRFNAIRSLTKINSSDTIVIVKKFIHDNDKKISEFVRNFLKKELSHE